MKCHLLVVLGVGLVKNYFTRLMVYQIGSRTQEVGVEELEMPLVRLGQPHPLLPRSTLSSIRTSANPSRNLSRKPSNCADCANKGLSRRSSLAVSSSLRRSR